MVEKEQSETARLNLIKQKLDEIWGLVKGLDDSLTNEIERANQLKKSLAERPTEEMATYRQKKYLKDLGVLQEEIDKMTKRDASRAIEKLKPEKKEKGKYFQ